MVSRFCFTQKKNPEWSSACIMNIFLLNISRTRKQQIGTNIGRDMSRGLGDLGSPGVLLVENSRAKRCTEMFNLWRPIRSRGRNARDDEEAKRTLQIAFYLTLKYTAEREQSLNTSATVVNAKPFLVCNDSGRERAQST